MLIGGGRGRTLLNGLGGGGLETKWGKALGRLIANLVPYCQRNHGNFFPEENNGWGGGRKEKEKQGGSGARLLLKPTEEGEPLVKTIC